MRYEKIKNTDVTITESDWVTVTEMGNTTEVQYMSRRNGQARIIKVSSEEYLHIETGEIRSFGKKPTTRMESENSVRKTMRRIRELVQTNVTDPRKVRWVTLTYAENMTDTKRLYEDFRRFNQRLVYNLKGRGIPKPGYIAVAEPQRRGAWHLHVLYIWKDCPAPYIANNDLARLWGHGYTSIKAVKDDTLASYLLAYLSDLDVPENLQEFFPADSKDVKTVDTGSGKPKRVVKGLRLNLYPSNFNIVRCSRDIRKPVKKQLPYGKAMELVADKELTYETSFRLSDNRGFESVVNRKEYRTRLKPDAI